MPPRATDINVITIASSTKTLPLGNESKRYLLSLSFLPGSCWYPVPQRVQEVYIDQELILTLPLDSVCSFNVETTCGFNQLLSLEGSSSGGHSHFCCDFYNPVSHMVLFSSLTFHCSANLPLATVQELTKSQTEIVFLEKSFIFFIFQCVRVLARAHESEQGCCMSWHSMKSEGQQEYSLSFHHVCPKNQVVKLTVCTINS